MDKTEDGQRNRDTDAEESSNSGQIKECEEVSRRPEETAHLTKLGVARENKTHWTHGHDLSPGPIMNNLLKLKEILELQIKEQKKELERHQTVLNQFKK
jgi:hypothetical protein